MVRCCRVPLIADKWIVMADNRHSQFDGPFPTHLRQSFGSMVAVLALLLVAGCEPEETVYSMPGSEDVPTATTTSETSPSETPPQQPPVETPAKSKPAATKAIAASAKKSRIEDKTFDDIKFDIEPDAPFTRDMLTDQIENLVGQRIRIRGWMLPTFQRENITRFVLVRDNLECCFGPGAALYDCIMVEMEPGTSADFSTQSVAVEGEFSINEFIGPDGKHLAIYHLDGERVK